MMHRQRPITTGKRKFFRRQPGNLRLFCFCTQFYDNFSFLCRYVINNNFYGKSNTAKMQILLLAICGVNRLA